MLDKVKVYMSTLNGELQLTPMNGGALTQAVKEPDENTFVIDPTVTHQPILGFGGTWMDTDVYHLMRMSPRKQEEVLRAIFDPIEGAGWNLMRVPLGSSDWERDTNFYTYDDMERGCKDWDLTSFSIQRDIDRGLPDLLHRAKQINPDIMLIASVWGVPGWMKENDSIMFGRFNPVCTYVYARYLRKAMQTWKELGIDFYAITTQNEPWTSEDRATPGCRFTWRLQAPVLKALRNEFDACGINTRIWCYDHNFDMAEAFVKPLLSDPELFRTIDGVAMHDYGGSAKVMGRLQQQFPDMPFYMTERHVIDPNGLERLIQQFHNGSRSYIQWSTITDEYGGPHQFLGNPYIYPNEPLPPERRNFVYNQLNSPDMWGKGSSWGLYGQFTKFLRRGMIRIDSTYGHTKWVTGAAFRHPDGEIAVVVVNRTNSEQSLTLRLGGGEYAALLPSQAICTYLVTPGPLCGEARLPVNAAPEKTFPVPPVFDLELTDIMLAEPVGAGKEAELMARVRNVGSAPTPSGCSMYVSFYLDGDCPIGRSVTVSSVIQPGEEAVVSANIPYGSKTTWTVESGYHFIQAYVVLGNTFQEQNSDNNRLVKEFYF